MTPRLVALRTGAAVLSAALITSPAIVAAAANGQARTPAPTVNPKALRSVVVEAYIGPRAYLGGAKLTLRDRTGRIIGRGLTRYTRGIDQINLPNGMRPKFPLTVTTSGGKITTLNGGGKGKRFTGTFTARVYAALPTSDRVQVSLVSTAASQMATSRRAYVRATARVNRTMGINKKAPADSLALRNDDVGYSQLMQAISRQGGMNAFARHLAVEATAGRKVGGLRPKSAQASGMPAPRGVRSSNQSSTQPMCGATLPNSNGLSGNSTTLIEDVGSVGVADILQYAGAPTEAALGVTGMLLAGVGDLGPSESNAGSVSTNLACLDELVGYLLKEVDMSALASSLTNAKACHDTVVGNSYYTAYEDMVADSTQQPGETPPDPTKGFTSQNNSFLTIYLPAWLSISTGTNDGCTGGDAINTALFAEDAALGYNAAWPQEWALEVGSGGWMSQTQSQALQNFLSYWSTTQYQQYVLQNEYNNWYGDTDAVANLAGGTANADGSLTCTRSTSTLPDTTNQAFCNYQANINAITPADLYSDEVGLVSSGIAVNAIPGGVVAPPAISNSPSKSSQAYNSSARNTSSSGKASYSPTALNPAWAFNYYLNWTPNTTAGANQIRTYFSGTDSTQYTSDPAIQCVSNALKSYGYSCPLSGTATINDFDSLALNYFNTAGVNPKAYGNAVETYNNPQATGRTSAMNSDIEALKNTGPGGMSAAQALYNGLNQTPGGGTAPLSGASPSVSSSQVLYMTPDNGYFTAQQGGQDELTWEGAYGATKSGWENSTSDIPGTPIFAFFTKRNWWTSASTASSFSSVPGA